MGRQAAGEAFLTGFVRHAQVDVLYCYAKSRKDFQDFYRRVTRLLGSERASRWIPYSRPAGLAAPGCLYHPDPGIGAYAWQRRHGDPRAYSLCGLTHTTASHSVMDAIGALLTAPVQPWDALVCTSSAVKATVDHVLASWGAYLEQRLGGRARRPVVQLPVIPLGADCDAFAPSEAAEGTRAALRQRYGIADEDIAVLFVGRLSFHAKAHPLPMYLGLEQAVRRTGKRIHLIQAGWFAHKAHEEQFRDGATALCPSVNVLFLDGREPAIRTGIWFAGDIFTSLSDNIQETFGLAPVEAMAAGLPVVVSDWNGYRDTVRDGIEGFTVPTVMPPTGLGADLALRHAMDIDSYDRYIGNASQCTGVEVAACAEAYTRLAANGELRHSMGAAGRRRAREVFDWRVIIAAYQELWRELAERRRVGREIAPRRRDAAANPLRDDPFALFASYPTRNIEPDDTVELAPEADTGRLGLMGAAPMTSFAAAVLSPAEDCDKVVRHLAEHGSCSVTALLEIVPRERRTRLHRTLGWLAKIHVVRIAPSKSADQPGETVAGGAR